MHAIHLRSAGSLLVGKNGSQFPPAVHQGVAPIPDLFSPNRSIAEVKDGGVGGLVRQMQRAAGRACIEHRPILIILLVCDQEEWIPHNPFDLWSAPGSMEGLRSASRRRKLKHFLRACAQRWPRFIPGMKMEIGKAKQLLNARIEAIAELGATSEKSPQFQKWKRDTEIAIERIFGESTRHRADFGHISFSPGVYYSGMPGDSYIKACKNGLDHARSVLESMIDELEIYGAQPNSECLDGLTVVANLCRRFHSVARQLSKRHAGRSPFKVEDEYDVQDLLHALLRSAFDDIRPEEWTPSYAGGSARVDFLLKREKIVIEVKKPREALGARQVGEQLIVDIQKYQSHQDFGRLICFVYDPDGHISNPRGLENDLNQEYGERVLVIIAPQH